MFVVPLFRAVAFRRVVNIPVQPLTHGLLSEWRKKSTSIVITFASASVTDLNSITPNYNELEITSRGDRNDRCIFFRSSYSCLQIDYLRRASKLFSLQASIHVCRSYSLTGSVISLSLQMIYDFDTFTIMLIILWSLISFFISTRFFTTKNSNSAVIKCNERF